MKKQIFALVFLATIIWVVFGQTLHFDFVNYDDDQYVYENPRIAGGLHWPAIAWVFTHSMCSNWHPVTWLSHLLDCQLYGLHPGGHHLTSVLLHAATAMLLFLWLQKFTPLRSEATAGQARLRSAAASPSTLNPQPSTTGFPAPSTLNPQPSTAFWPSLFVAAVFAIHPLRVESVAWISERKDVLSGFFFMLTLWAYARYAHKAESRKQKAEIGNLKAEIGGHRAGGKHSTFNIQHPTSSERGRGRSGEEGKHSTFNIQHSTSSEQTGGGFTSSILHPLSSPAYWLSLSCFALGLMSKPMLVTLPFVLLLLDYWPLGRFTLHASRFTLLRPLLLEKLPFLALAAASCVVTVLAQDKVEAAVQNLTISWRIENAIVAYAGYLGQTLVPAGLAVFYPLPGIRPSLWLVAASALVLLMISLGAVAGRRKHPWLLVGWLWYLGMLVPVIGLVQVGAQARADRYTYLPQIGLCVLAVWGAAAVRSPAFMPSPAARRHRRVWLGSVGVAILGALIAAAYLQTGYWKDSVSLWTHTLACTSGNWVAHENLGNALMKQKKFAEAVEHYEQTIQLKPYEAQARYDLGIALAAQGDAAQALEQYQRALEIKPDYADVHVNLGNLLAQQGRLAEAVEHFQRALQIKPDHAKAHVNLGNVLSAQGQWNEAVEHYERALQIKPDYTLACFNLGNVLASHGKLAEAAPWFQRALTLATAQGNLPLAAAIRSRLQVLPVTGGGGEKMEDGR